MDEVGVTHRMEAVSDQHDCLTSRGQSTDLIENPLLSHCVKGTRRLVDHQDPGTLGPSAGYPTSCHPADADIDPDRERPAEERLRHEGDAGEDLAAVGFGGIDAVPPDRAAVPVRHVQAGQQVDRVAVGR
ncbi:hypothetical protein [Streptomyces sp. H27-H1]|uniref:hypothetical protein n=1 Tax=Streptomyces sp. H27-H1 TaxID=2996461 RepID=UPI003B640717